MRIDKLLNKLCLVKTRTIAKKACDKNLVKLNGKIVKASSIVNNEDVIEYKLFGYSTQLKIINIPKGNVSKAKAPEFYEILKNEKMDF